MLGPDRNLPNETLVHIFTLLSQADLTKVALALYRFNAIAKRVLYSSIDITEQLTEDSDVLKRTLGWCDVLKRDQLYNAPRKLSIRWRICKTNIINSKTFRHSCSLVNESIRCLTLLHTLELVVGPSVNVPTSALRLVIRDLRLPNLRHCLLSAADANYSLHETESSDICAFIASHSRLRYLAVTETSGSAMELLPYHAVPELPIFFAEQPAEQRLFF